ncbi:hypothetical protein ACVDG3_16225 [Meridianimarinicoccus sp. RP-17]|uniref:hypothetical protein n=1 Tax=Meridianimarinicoccus zhengii TaxID=2056810 RepID=UPI000DAB4DA4|nr:hypothetical protein [Phycocomes zhengii]
MSLAVAPTAAAVQPLRSVYAANAAAVAPAQPPAAAAPAARGREMPAASHVAEIVVTAAARTNAAAYDCRVTGATETVTGFDRVAMVKEGFEHMRTLFELANGGERTPAFTMVDARV